MSKEGNMAGNSTETAVRWYRRLVEGDVSTLSTKDLIDWAAWSTQPQNIRTFRQVNRIWGACGASTLSTALPGDAEIAADEYDGSVSMSEWLSTRRHNKRDSSRGGPVMDLDRSRRVPKYFLYAAACLTTIGVLLGIYHQLLGEKLSGESRTYVTTSTQRKVVTLPDGSVITLAPDTKLMTHCTVGRSYVVLEKGEAWFKVARNSTRPFTVSAGTGEVVVLGTQFDVRREKGAAGTDRVTVAVGYGSVEVRPPPKDLLMSSQAKDMNPVAWTPARLTPGQEVTYDASGRRGTVTEVDLEGVAAWKQVKLEYRQTPLRVVLEEVSRYSEKPIVLSDSDGSVGAIPFTGTFFEFRVTGWLQALQATYPVEIMERPDRFVVRPVHTQAQP